MYERESDLIQAISGASHTLVNQNNIYYSIEIIANMFYKHTGHRTLYSKPE